MLPGDGPAPFDDDGWFFEPWWPGVLATVVVDGGRVDLIADQLTDPLPAFPELRTVASQLNAAAAVITGTLLVLDADGRPDAPGLRRRLTDPDDRPGMGAFIAADLLSKEVRSIFSATLKLQAALTISGNDDVRERVQAVITELDELTSELRKDVFV